ncbi:hypothetical protein H5410_002719 [Solanum commersonii]|uniref:Uncharacterized protein n=1 Tax=Solanum commersonii TaxID=4109 RepID=A0A9J6B344_SOLCO|nr:hypothetical protein H5410_002719 [Solanum commersonii]
MKAIKNLHSSIEYCTTFLPTSCPYFHYQKKIQERLDRLRRDFLWEGNCETNKFHLVIIPKRHNGLVVKDLIMHNKSFRMKCHWIYMENPKL